MEILFARHGNTFAPGEPAVWVGRETDLPLVAKGLAQAEEAAESLRQSGLTPDVIYAASLQRTRRFAEIIAERLGLAEPMVDPRLDEVDYGTWAGRTNDEIAALGADAQSAMEAWGGTDTWPPAGCGWGSQQAEVMSAIEGFAADYLAAGLRQRPLVVSSNGILRFLPRAVLGPKDQRASFKMRTGHLGLIARENAHASLRCWDMAPAEFEQFCGG